MNADSQKQPTANLPYAPFLAALVMTAGCSSETPPAKSNPTTPPQIAIEPTVLEPLPEPEGQTDGQDSIYTIAQVMTLAHDNKLYRELFSQPVDPIVGERLIRLYEDLPKQDPPLGDPAQWRERTNALIDAAKAIVQPAKAPNPEAIAAFKRAVNCNSCHSRHRG